MGAIISGVLGLLIGVTATEARAQPKQDDRVAPPTRRIVPGALPPRPRKKLRTPERRPLSLEVDPCDLLPLALDRNRFIWLASPRLRTSAWVMVHGFSNPSVRYRKYEPEIVYDKKDLSLAAEVGGAVRLGRFELSLVVPFVGMMLSDFYQKGVVDQDVSKTDRADMSVTGKIGFRWKRRRNVWLLSPYLTLGLPTGSRERYSVGLGGRTVEHDTAAPLAFSFLPGVAVGWRNGMFSAVVSVGVLTRVVARDKHYTDEPVGQTTASWFSAYQFGITPFRDIVGTIGLQHVHQLIDRVPGESEDLLFFAPGVRFQPYHGLHGHVGLSIPITKKTLATAPVMLTLEMGWEFR